MTVSEQSRAHSPDIETLAPDELEALVCERLRHTASYAVEHSEYWADRFREAGLDPTAIEEPADLLALPPITNEEFMARQPPEADEFGWPIIHDDMSYHAHCTSGTTGAEKWVVVNEDDTALSDEAVRRGLAAAGVSDDDRLANFLPKGLYMSGKQSEHAANGYVRIHEAFGHTNTPPRSRILSMFKGTALAPTVLFASPSAIEQIARELREIGIDPAEIGVESILLVGEASGEERRRSIADTYEADVTNNYAATELGFAAYDPVNCHGDGMHVIEDLRLVLVVNEEENRLTEPGETGNVWYSTLYPEGMRGGTPLFNYKPGDVARYVGRGECECGRTHKRIADVVRADNAVQIHQAARITPAQVENVIHSSPFVEVLSGEYVVTVESRDSPRDTIRLLVEKDTGQPERVPDRFTEDDVVNWTAISHEVRQCFVRDHVALDAFETGDYITIQVSAVDPGELPLAEGGKPNRIQIKD